MVNRGSHLSFQSYILPDAYDIKNQVKTAYHETKTEVKYDLFTTKYVQMHKKVDYSPRIIKTPVSAKGAKFAEAADVSVGTISSPLRLRSQSSLVQQSFS